MQKGKALFCFIVPFPVGVRRRRVPRGEGEGSCMLRSGGGEGLKLKGWGCEGRGRGGNFHLRHSTLTSVPISPQFAFRTRASRQLFVCSCPFAQTVFRRVVSARSAPCVTMKRTRISWAGSPLTNVTRRLTHRTRDLGSTEVFNPITTTFDPHTNFVGSSHEGVKIERCMLN